MNKKTIMMLIGCFWLIILVAFVGTKEYTLRTGTTVLLKTIPVDPRDLFRGDYVILRYDISRLTTKYWPHKDHTFKDGDRIYLMLERDGEYAVPSRVMLAQPSGGLFVRGEVVRTRSGSIEVEYGIESYFVPEGEGKPIEHSRNRGKVSVRVAIDKKGQAVIKDLLMDGKEVKFE